MSNLLIWIVILVFIIVIFFFSAKVRNLLKVRKWRKGLERNDYVKFFHGSTWHIGKIRHFRDNGQTLIVREITSELHRNPFQFTIPIKIVVPTYPI